MTNILSIERKLYLALIVLLLSVSPAQAMDYLEPGDVKAGAKAWADNCSRCHNARDPQDLRDDQWITSVFHMRVRAGLTGQQARDILGYLQSANNLAVKDSDARSVRPAHESRSGQQVYEQVCSACHGTDGTGTVPGAPDFSRADGPLSQGDEVLMTRIRDGFQSPRSPMAMPPRGGDPGLNAEEIEQVLAYMKTAFVR